VRFAGHERYVPLVNDAQNALLSRLREIVEQAPSSGAKTAAGKPLYLTHVSKAVENRMDDGPALVKYVRSKVQGPPSTSYEQLIAAGRADLTLEAIVADVDAAWASEFTDDDRAAAQARIGRMVEAHREAREAAAGEAVAQDRKTLERVNESRVAKGKPAMTQTQEDDMLKNLAARRDKRA
jgi:hypothetical protein